MGNSKDKRIKKLKKKRIWPSVLGLFLITGIFCVVILITLASAGIEVIYGKLAQSNSRSAAIAKVMVDYNGENSQKVQDAILMQVELLDEMEAVWIADANGDKLWSSSEATPDREREDEFYFTDKEVIKLIIEEDLEKVFVYNEHGVDINDNIFKVIEFSNFTDASSFFDNDKESAVMQFKIWFVHEVEDLEVYVLHDICIYGHEFILLIISIFLMGIMLTVFIVYYLISFIGIIINTRKTTRLIYTDFVTGGNNWLHFVKKGTKLLKKKAFGRNYAVVHMKMRKYRSFCTCFGVKEGEALIEKMYRVLNKNLKHNEAMAHQENAEFGLMLAYTDKQQLIARIESIEKALNAILPKMKLYFAVGVYEVQQKERDIEQLYNNAMLACDMLGEEVENQTAFFDIEMNKQKLWERMVEDNMDAALANREFQVYLQPKVNASQGELAGAEALVRWIHPKEGFIPPNKFIPIFEQNGFILKLDDYMLEEIAKQQAQWMAQGKKIVPISVNVSRAHFTREDLAQHICNIVDKYHVPHNVIELELTESAFFDDKKVLLNTVKQLRDAGFLVSMDDFGSGYSSLNSLKELQLDVLKLDADFFRGADSQERGLLIVSEVIDLAKKLNMKIVAEGIESREQVDFLIEQECDLIQGYYFAKPMPIREFEEKYKAV